MVYNDSRSFLLDINFDTWPLIGEATSAHPASRAIANATTSFLVTLSSMLSFIATEKKGQVCACRRRLLRGNWTLPSYGMQGEDLPNCRFPGI